MAQFTKEIGRRIEEIDLAEPTDSAAVLAEMRLMDDNFTDIQNLVKKVSTCALNLHQSLSALRQEKTSTHFESIQDCLDLMKFDIEDIKRDIKDASEDVEAMAGITHQAFTRTHAFVLLSRQEIGLVYLGLETADSKLSSKDRMKPLGLLDFRCKLWNTEFDLYRIGKNVCKVNKMTKSIKEKFKA